MNEEQIKQIVHEVLRDPRLGSGVAEAASAPFRTEMASPGFNPAVRKNHGIPPTARAAVLVEKKRLELKGFPLRKIREDEILVRVLVIASNVELRICQDHIERHDLIHFFRQAAQELAEGV